MTHTDQHAVAVVGAGIVGVSCAVWLQRAGFRVLLIDREGPAAGTSHGNAGVLASCSVVPVTVPGLIRKAPGMLLGRDQPLFLNWPYLPRLTPWLLKYLSHCNPPEVRRIAAALTPIVGDSLTQHQALSAGTGAERWVVPGDYVFAYKDKAHFDADAFGWAVRRENHFQWEEMDRAAYQAFDPVFDNQVGYAVRVGEHGRISDPGRYVKDLAAFVESRGGQFIRGAVEAVVSENGAVSAIRVDGQNIHCNAAVIASGVWSGPLASQLGINVPLESERGYHLEFWDADRMPKEPVMMAALKVVATPMDGRLRLAGAVEFGGLKAAPNDPPFALLERAIQKMLPGIKYSRTEQWMGHRPAPADSIPIIGEAPGVKRAFLAFGHHHVGLTGGAKTGRLIAQMIAGKPTDVDMSPYRPGRF